MGACTAKTKYRNFETNIPREGISGSQSQFPHSWVCERFIYSHNQSPYSAGGNILTDPGTISIAHRHMNVEIGADATLFPEKQYIKGIFVAVWYQVSWPASLTPPPPHLCCLSYLAYRQPYNLTHGFTRVCCNSSPRIIIIVTYANDYCQENFHQLKPLCKPSVCSKTDQTQNIRPEPNRHIWAQCIEIH